MSRNDAGRRTDAAALAHIPEDALPAPTIEQETCLMDDNTREGEVAADSWHPRLVNRARIGPSRHAHSHSFNDPSNYLG